MSVDIKLYVNPLKWSNRDLVDLVHLQVKNIYGKNEMLHPMKIDGLEGSVFMYYPIKNGPGMVMITMSDVAGFPARVISIGRPNPAQARRKSENVLKNIAEKIGGLLMESDDNNHFEEFDDPFMNEQDFTLKMIQKGGSYYDVLNDRNNKDIDELVDSLQKMKKSEE